MRSPVVLWPTISPNCIRRLLPPHTYCERSLSLNVVCGRWNINQDHVKKWCVSRALIRPLCVFAIIIIDTAALLQSRKGTRDFCISPRFSSSSFAEDSNQSKVNSSQALQVSLIVTLRNIKAFSLLWNSPVKKLQWVTVIAWSYLAHGFDWSPAFEWSPALNWHHWGPETSQPRFPIVFNRETLLHLASVPIEGLWKGI